MKNIKYSEIEALLPSEMVDDVPEVLSKLGVKSLEEFNEFWDSPRHGLIANPDFDPLVIDGNEEVRVVYRLKDENVILNDYDNPFGEESDSQIEHFHSQKMYDDFVKKNNKKDYVLLEKYSHSAVHYSVLGTGNYPDRRWDVSEGCAALLLGDTFKTLRRSLVAKHGKDVGTEKFNEALNKSLDLYSNYCNGYGCEMGVVVVSKEDGSVEPFTTGVYFDEDEMLMSVIHENINYIAAKEVDEVKSNIVKNTDPKVADLKGFENNVMKKDAKSLELVTLFNQDGLKTDVLFVEFESEIVKYLKSEDTRVLKGNPTKESWKIHSGQSVDSIKNWIVNGLVSELVVLDMQENAKRNDIDLSSESRVGLKM